MTQSHKVFFCLDFTESLFERCMVEYFIFNMIIFIASMCVCIEYILIQALRLSH